MSPPPTKTILVIDACSDKNAGDAAMQLALRDLINDVAPDTRMLVATRFGFNQKSKAIKELQSFSNTQNVQILSGAYPTFVHFGVSENFFSKLRRKFGKAIAAAYVTPLLIAYAAHSKHLPTWLSRWQGSNLFHHAQHSDFIIWNGRNFRRIDGIRGYFKLVELLANPAFIASTPTPKAMYGVSFWPVQSKFAKWIVRGVMSRFDHIYVRESESLRIGKSLGLTNIVLMPDLSFYHLTKLLAKSQNTPVPLTSRLPQAALTLVAERELNGLDLNEYVHIVASAILHLQQVYGLTVVIVRQVTYGPEVEDETIDLINQICGPIKVLPPPSDIDDLLGVYSHSRIVIATRMHSAIFAVSCGTPVVTLPYDWKGKWQILADLGLPQTCMIPLETATSGALINGIDTALKGNVDWGSIGQRIHDEAERLRVLVTKDLT